MRTSPHHCPHGQLADRMKHPCLVLAWLAGVLLLMAAVPQKAGATTIAAGRSLAAPRDVTDCDQKHNDHKNQQNCQGQKQDQDQKQDQKQQVTVTITNVINLPPAAPTPAPPPPCTVTCVPAPSPPCTVTCVPVSSTCVICTPQPPTTIIIVPPGLCLILCDP